MAAGGLYARFDCGMPRDPKMSRAGALGRLIYMEAVMYSKENMTDGVIERVALAHFTVDIDAKTKTRELNRLAKLGALEQMKNGWRIPSDVWCRWNSTKEQVEQKRADAAARKAQYRAAKRSDASESVPPMSQWDNDGTGEAVPHVSSTPETEPKTEPKTEPETETETETEPETESKPVSSSSVLTLVPGGRDDDDSMFDLVTRIIAEAHRDALARSKPNHTIGDLNAWLSTDRRHTSHNHGDEIRTRLTGGADPVEVAGAVLGNHTDARIAARTLGIGAAS